MDYIRKVFLDPSALIVWILYPDKNEPGGEVLSKYLLEPSHLAYTTEQCRTEAISRLRQMNREGQITQAGCEMRIEDLKEKRKLHIEPDVDYMSHDPVEGRLLITFDKECRSVAKNSGRPVWFPSEDSEPTPALS